MKILITDEHFGVRNNDINIYNQQKLAFKEMFAYMKENNITEIYSLGDFFDNRVSISSLILHNLIKDFFDVIEKNNWKITMLVGNHNIFYKDTLEVNNIDIFGKMYPNNVTIIKKQTIIDIYDKKVLLCPWLLHNEKIEIKENIDMVLAHAEVNGFYVSKTFMLNSKDALEPDTIKTPVISGHFHISQENKNFKFLGNSFIQTNWSDFKSPKGFHVLHPALSTTFIENTASSKHVKVHININDKTCLVEGLRENDITLKLNNKTDYSIFTNHRLKVYANKETIVTKRFIENIEQIASNYKLEIHNDELKDINIEERIDKAKNYSIEEQIIAVNEETDKNIILDILNEAKELMI